MQAAPLLPLPTTSVAGERQTFIRSLLSPMGASPGRNLTRARLVASFAGSFSLRKKSHHRIKRFNHPYLFAFRWMYYSARSVVLYTAGRRRERSPGLPIVNTIFLMPSVTNRKEFTPSGRGSVCGFESKRLRHAGRV